MNFSLLKHYKQTQFEWREYLSILLIAILFSITIFLLLPFSTNKYQLKIINQRTGEFIFASLLADLDGDKYSEFLRFKINNGIPAISIENSDRNIIEQINLNGIWVEKSIPLTTDLDKDGYLEIISFTYFKDSIWVNIFEPMQKSDAIILRKAIDHVNLNEGNQDWIVNIAEPANLTGNYYNDLVISIYSGFTLEPRKLYILDVDSDKLLKQSVNLGNNITNPIIVDINQDGVPEITGSSFAPDNLGGENVILSDSVSWFLLFDAALNFASPPVSFPGSPSYISAVPLDFEDEQLLIVLYTHRDHEVDQPAQLISYKWINDSLEIIKSIKLSTDSHLSIIGKDPLNPGHFYLCENGMVYRYSRDLNLRKKIRTEIYDNHIEWQKKDIDLDGNEEFLAFSNSGTLTIFRSNFRKAQGIEFPAMGMRVLLSTNSGDKPGEFHVQSNNRLYDFKYQVNPYFYYRWVLFLFILLINILFFLSLAGIFKGRIQERQKRETALLHYQLTNVQQQLDPHFLFNVLNNISYFYLEGKKEDALDYLSRITRLVTASLENSEKLTIRLKEELQFTRNYLFLEKLRSNDKFDFSTGIEDEDVLNVQIPKMLIQNFAENSVKHGIFHLTKRKGFIKIYSLFFDDHIHIIVEDNGIGRKKAQEMNTNGTGKGIRIIDRILSLYEKITEIRIQYQIEDLHDKTGDPSGTKVTIIIPLEH
jgi:hypothetical protein